MSLELESDATGKDGALVVLPDAAFTNGTIELDVAGDVATFADAGARGFVGLAFHVSADGNAFDLFYLRPTNGRADDQLRRNHSVQYAAEPDHGWQLLRAQSPGVYESYADVRPGVWIRLRAEVKGRTARFYVNRARQPCLVVNDLVRSNQAGRVALWAGPGTIAHFCRLRIIRKE